MYKPKFTFLEVIKNLKLLDIHYDLSSLQNSDMKG